MKKKRWSHFQKIIYTIVIAFAIVSFWRGVWGLMDEYLFPTNPTLSFSISVLVGILILSQTKHLLKHLI